MTTYLTIDAGLTYRLITPHANQQKFLEQVTRWQRAGYQLCAPTLWAYELTSTFTKMVHFGQLGASSAREGIRLAYEIGIQLAPPDENLILKAYAWTQNLRRASAYDGFYLALAETIGCEFWTADKRLVNAVAKSWVKLLE